MGSVAWANLHVTICQPISFFCWCKHGEKIGSIKIKSVVLPQILISRVEFRALIHSLCKLRQIVPIN